MSTTFGFLGLRQVNCQLRPLKVDKTKISGFSNRNRGSSFSSGFPSSMGFVRATSKIQVPPGVPSSLETKEDLCEVVSLTSFLVIHRPFVVISAMAGFTTRIDSALRQLSLSKSADIKPEAEYIGYQPLCAADLPFEEDIAPCLDDGGEKGLDLNMLRDKGKTSKSLLLSVILFTMSFIAMVVWQVLVAKCKLDTLCETIDNSSLLASEYLFKTLRFRVPAALVWVGLTAGSFGLLVAVTWTFLLLRRSVGPAKLVEVAMIMRKGASAVLSHQYIALFGPVLIMLIFLGVAVNWKTASCFAFGALMCIITSHAGVSVTTRASIRSTAAAWSGLRESFRVTFRSGATISLSVLGIGVLGLSAMYLMFSDVQALAGMAAGASAIALFVAMYSGIFTRATCDAANILRDREYTDVACDDRCNANLASCIASGIGTIAVLGSDLFSSLICSVVATAILGSSLPFFYRDSFAMCVFNHLAVDQECGPFGYPERLSYSIYICSNENLYLEYPTLRTWASNSAFVAVPFVLAVIGLLACILSSLRLPNSGVNLSEARRADDVIAVVKKLQRRMLPNVFCGNVVIIVGAAALCFGLFGPHSEFQQADGFGKERLLNRMKLDGSTTQCVSKFLNKSSGSRLNPHPVPQGGRLVSDHYRPVSISGLKLGTAGSTPWRLFGCVMIGVGLAVLLTAVSKQFHTTTPKSPKHKLFIASEFSQSTGVMEGMASSLSYTALPTVLILASLLSSYTLYGPYGTGLTTLGFLCSVGVTIKSSAMGIVSDNANDFAWIAKLQDGVLVCTEVLSILGYRERASGMELLNGASVLSACTVLLALVQQSGIIPSPRDLIGSPELAPTRFIAGVGAVSLTDMSVVISFVVGTMLPFLIAGLLILGSTEACNIAVTEARRLSSLSPRRPYYALFFGRVTRTALMETAIPLSISIIMPLAVGFGFGQRALIGFLTGVISNGYILGTFLTSTASNWKSFDQYFSARLVVDPYLVDVRTRVSTEISDFWGVAGPSLQTLVKLTTSISLVTITLMQPDNIKGWIGGAILAGLVVFVALVLFMKRFRSSRIHSRLERGADGKAKAPPKLVSPFYEDGPMIDPATVRPGSQVHEALLAIGNPTWPVSPRVLPGLSDRSRVEMENQHDFMSPRTPIPTLGPVYRDTFRDTEQEQDEI